MIPKGQRPFTVAWRCAFESRVEMFELSWHRCYEW